MILRPLILLLILIPLFWRFKSRSTSAGSVWKKWVDQKLLPDLLVSHLSKWRTSGWRLSLILLWSGFVVAASGLAFTKIPVPVSHTMPNTVIVFDLGPSMQGTTLAAAKLKLHDLLTALKGNRIGLVLYADKGFTAVPLTPDRGIVRALIPTLDSSVLPTQGQNPAKGFEKASELIQQTGGKGRIIYITAGGVDGRDIHSSYPIGILGMDDKAISSKIKQLGTYRAKTTDASDIIALLKATEPDTVIQFDEIGEMDEWADLGALLALILLPFMAFTFRKGYLFILLLGLSFSANAAFLWRPDQERYQQLIQAVQDYRAKDYEKAITGFANHPYNRGNALAYAGQIEKAIQSYAEALEKDPNDEDARFNKEYLEKQLPPPEQQQNQDQQQSEGNQNDQNQQQDQSQSDNNEEESQEQQQSNSQETQQDSQDKENQEQSDANPDQQNNEAESSEPAQIDEQDREQQPFDQEEQQILNRLQNDPYRVLRYRLLQQARKK